MGGEWRRWVCRAARVEAQFRFVFYFLLMMQEENAAKRESQSIAMLQKLIRVDSKDCNFFFRDQSRNAYFKVSYPQTNIYNHSNEALLRQFWHHIYAHYFKKIQPEEMRRFQYLQSVFHVDGMDLELGQDSSHSLLAQNADLLDDMDQVLSPSYMQKLKGELRSESEDALWLKTLNLQRVALELGERGSPKKTKLICSKLKQNRRQRKLMKAKKTLNAALRQDEQQVDAYLQELAVLRKQNMSEIDRKAGLLEQELAELRRESARLVRSLEDRIKAEDCSCEHRTYSKSLVGMSGQKENNSAKDLQCLEYLIRSLEEKQIAESVAKITSTERSSGEIMFQLTYEKAINLEPKLASEKQLQRVNFLRETSLVQFYRTGVKSLYSYVCHNYVGFRELMQNRCNVTAKLKDKCMVQMMKKGACLASIVEIQHQMAKFSMCHHCKFLFQDHMLFSCKFASDKQAIPKMNLEAACDPNLAEAFHGGPNRNRTSQRFMTRKKNCLTSYAKIHDEYVCGRKYCFSCLKDTYSHENIKQNGLCPFCLGVCVCTRCLRNEKIAKFKNMYSSLGGDLTKIQENSDLEQLQPKSDDQLQRGRGRPKKYAISHIAVNSTQKKLRRFEQTENYTCASVLVSGKLRKKSHLYSHWKRNDSGGNETQEEYEVKRKIKRRVGRPRIHKSGRLDNRKKLALYY